MVAVGANGRHDVRCDRQEQGAGSKVDEPREGVVAVALGIGTDADYDSSQDSVDEHKHVHPPQGPSHGLAEGCHGFMRADDARGALLQ